jgi:two-component sensor histidine kinase
LPQTPELTVENFSFINDPAGTLGALRKIGEIEARELEAHLHFVDPHCLDIGPYLVLGEIWPSMARVFRGGRMATPVQKVIHAVGLRAPLRMKLRAVRDLNDIWAFPLQQRRPAGISKSLKKDLEPQARERVADRFCDAVNVWLDRPEINQKLTTEGRAWITTIITELLDNAERHSAPETKDGDWSLTAFMVRRREEGEYVYRCSMAFLSVGATMWESFRGCSDRVQGELQTYCDRHARRGISRETLGTLLALQDGITRDPEADAAARGGYGLQEVLELLNELGGTAKPGRDPHLTIVSGSSCIKLGKPYIKGERRGGPEEPRVLWCNPANSPEDPPDGEFVFDLPERFAGTLITLSFTLDPDYLNETVDAYED